MSANVSAVTTIDIRSIDPVKPKPKSDVKIVAEISNVDILKVDITVGECNKKELVCYNYITKEMTEVSTGLYEAEISLESANADYIDIGFEVTYFDENSDTYDNDMWEYDLDTESVDDGSNNDGSPGFELILFFISLIFCFILIKIKR